ncbi:MAG TPA: hypothetical protein VF615_00770 [Longimicrobiaceae bacterium]
MRFVLATVAIIASAACGGGAGSAATRTDRHADAGPARNAASDTMALVVVDRPTVIGYFPPAADSTEAEEAGYSEGVAHVGFALEDAESRLGRDNAHVALVVDTAVRLQYRGRTDTLRFSRVDSLSFGAYLIAPERPPRLVHAPSPSALIPAVAAAIPEYFHRQPCPER